MEKLYIICVDDQREVLSAIMSDIAIFADYLIVEECESADEVLELAEEIDSNGDFLALVISDHVMPRKSGVDLLAELHVDSRFAATRKVLLTGQATHSDTIEAINRAEIERYFEKPWDKINLIESIKVLITKFIFMKGLDYKPYMPILDQSTLLNALRKP